MPLFTPSAISENPAILPDRAEMAPGAYSLRRHYRAGMAGVNVYIYKAGSISAVAFGRVTESDPVASYDSSGVLTSDGWQDIELVAWGGHIGVEVTTDQANALIAAGYTVQSDPLFWNDADALLIDTDPNNLLI